MERAIVTFHDPKTNQKIIVNMGHNAETNELDIKCKFDPTPNEDDELGFIGFLSEMFLTNLYNEQNIPTESDCGQPSLRD